MIDLKKIEDRLVEPSIFYGKRFWLTACDYEAIELKEFSTCYTEQCLSFTVQFAADRITGESTTYIAVQDPDDGYRSSMKCLITSKAELRNKFKPCEVLGSVMADHSDVTEFVDVHTKKVVLEFGTNHDDSWYPTYVANFDPTAMHANKDVEPYDPFDL